MLENIRDYHILLASNSPRRRELLSGLGVDYEVTSLPDVDEGFPEGLTKEEIPQYIAKNKALAYQDQMQENTLLITADTIVWLEGEVFGKPASAEEAKAMLSKLSGKSHYVVTGVCLQTATQQTSFASTTEVKFAELTEEEIAHYVATYRPFDKAGSYGIQEWIGFVGVESIQGSYFNVMGLPIHRLYEELKKL